MFAQARPDGQRVSSIKTAIRIKPTLSGEKRLSGVTPP